MAHIIQFYELTAGQRLMERLYTVSKVFWAFFASQQECRYRHGEVPKAILFDGTVLPNNNFSVIHDFGPQSEPAVNPFSQ